MGAFTFTITDNITSPASVTPLSTAVAQLGLGVMKVLGYSCASLARVNHRGQLMVLAYCSANYLSLQFLPWRESSQVR